MVAPGGPGIKRQKSTGSETGGKKKQSKEQLTKLYLQRIEQENQKLNDRSLTGKDQKRKNISKKGSGLDQPLTKTNSKTNMADADQKPTTPNTDATSDKGASMANGARPAGSASPVGSAQSGLVDTDVAAMPLPATSVPPQETPDRAAATDLTQDPQAARCPTRPTMEEPSPPVGTTGGQLFDNAATTSEAKPPDPVQQQALSSTTAAVSSAQSSPGASAEAKAKAAAALQQQQTGLLSTLKPGSHAAPRQKSHPQPGGAVSPAVRGPADTAKLQYHRSEPTPHRRGMPVDTPGAAAGHDANDVLSQAGSLKEIQQPMDASQERVEVDAKIRKHVNKLNDLLDRMRKKHLEDYNRRLAEISEMANAWFGGLQTGSQKERVQTVQTSFGAHLHRLQNNANNLWGAQRNNQFQPHLILQHPSATSLPVASRPVVAPQGAASYPPATTAPAVGVALAPHQLATQRPPPASQTSSPAPVAANQLGALRASPPTVYQHPTQPAAVPPQQPVVAQHPVGLVASPLVASNAAGAPGGPRPPLRQQAA